MTDEQPPEQEPEQPPEQPPAEPDWARRRRLAAVFGDVLPEATGDDRAEPGSEPAGEQRSEEWLRRQVPPHHG